MSSTPLPPLPFILTYYYPSPSYPNLYLLPSLPLTHPNTSPPLTFTQPTPNLHFYLPLLPPLFFAGSFLLHFYFIPMMHMHLLGRATYAFSSTCYSTSHSSLKICTVKVCLEISKISGRSQSTFHCPHANTPKIKFPNFQVYTTENSHGIHMQIKLMKKPYVLKAPSHVMT